MSSTFTAQSVKSAPTKHTTAHLRDEFTRRDLFGVVRGRCTAVRAVLCLLLRGAKPGCGAWTRHDATLT